MTGSIQLASSDYEYTIANIIYTFFDYYPSDFVLTYSQHMIWNDYKLVRENIYKFRDGIDQAWPKAIIQHIIHKKLISLIDAKTIELNTDNWALVCPPASTKEANEIRFKDICQNLCHFFAKLQNGFDHIEIINEKEPKYIEDKLNDKEHTTWDIDQDLKFDEEFFKGKDIILFDDIVTTGETMTQFIYKLKQLGANPILCASILYTPKIFGESKFVRKKRIKAVQPVQALQPVSED